jgi:hypothetical protein
MLTPAVNKLEKKDADICRAFKAVVLKGKFEVQGEALAQVGAFFRWFSDLDKRIEETLKVPQETIRKDLEPEKKAKK